MLDSIQVLNTAIIKNKENEINTQYEIRLKEISESPAIEAINIAINHLAKKESMSRDQAAQEIIQAMKNLESVWSDYVMMEGIEHLKESLQ